MGDIPFNCPNCKRGLVAKAQHAGATVKCPDCKTPIRVPGGTPPPVQASVYVQPVITAAVPAQGPTIIVKGKGEGCFLQTLNAGCFLVVFGIVITIVIVFLAWPS